MDTCYFCLEDIATDLHEFPCHHKVHKDCLIEGLLAGIKNECGQCRRSMKTGAVEENEESSDEEEDDEEEEEEEEEESTNNIGGIFRLVRDDLRADRMIMATDLLNERINAIMRMQADPNIPDPIPILIDRRPTTTNQFADYQPHAIGCSSVAVGCGSIAVGSDSSNVAVGCSSVAVGSDSSVGYVPFGSVNYSRYDYVSDDMVEEVIASGFSGDYSQKTRYWNV